MRKKNLLRTSIIGDGVYTNLLVSKTRFADVHNLQKKILNKYAGFLGTLLRLYKRNHLLQPGLSFIFALLFIQSDKRDVIRSFKNIVHTNVEKSVQMVLPNERSDFTGLKLHSIYKSFFTLLSSIYDRTVINCLNKTGVSVKHENLTISKTGASERQLVAPQYNLISYKSTPKFKFLTTMRQTLASPVKFLRSHSAERFHHEPTSYKPATEFKFLTTMRQTLVSPVKFLRSRGAERFHHEPTSYKPATEFKFLTTMRQTLANPVKFLRSSSVERFHRETIKQTVTSPLPVIANTPTVSENYISYGSRGSDKYEFHVGGQNTESIINHLRQFNVTAARRTFSVLPDQIRNFFVTPDIRKKISHLTKVHILANKLDKSESDKVQRNILNTSLTDKRPGAFTLEEYRGIAETHNPVYNAHAFRQECRNTLESITITALRRESITERNRVRESVRSLDLTHKIQDINTNREDIGNTLYTAYNAVNGHPDPNGYGEPFSTVAETAPFSIPVGLTETPKRKDGLRQEDVGAIANEVYSIIEDKIRTENERRGIFY